MRLEHRLALTLQFPQGMGHADVRERQVVPSRRLGFVAVIAAQQGVDVVGTGARVTGARASDQGQVGRVRAEPGLGLARVDRGLHRVADLVGGEGEVVGNLLVVQADVAQAVVAHVPGGMAVQAVVDEQLGAVLQRRHVGRLFLGELVPGDAAAGGVGAGHEAERHDQGEEDLLHDGVVPGWRVSGRRRSRGRAPA